MVNLISKHLCITPLDEKRAMDLNALMTSRRHLARLNNDETMENAQVFVCMCSAHVGPMRSLILTSSRGRPTPMMSCASGLLSWENVLIQ